MKVQQLAVGGFWEQQQQDSSSPSSSSSSSTSIASASLTINYFKLLRPLSPNLTATTASSATQTNTFLDLKGFHTPKTKCTAQNPDSAQVEMQPGGTRWNPAPEQIRVLEALYMSGMRTPNAHQIERITDELRKYGRIEGKNVFYWFQNHKARERQKQKRSALLALSSINHYNSASPPIMTLISSRANGGNGGKEADREECYDGSCKRNCRRWGCLGPDVVEAEGRGDRTLELFPLHPKGKQMR